MAPVRGSFLVVAITLAHLALLRIDGVDGDLRADLPLALERHRAEDKFLAEQAEGSSISTDSRLLTLPDRAPTLHPGDWGEVPRGRSRRRDPAGCKSARTGLRPLLDWYGGDESARPGRV